MSHVNQSLTNVSLNQTAASGNQQANSMEEEFEDDGLDELVSAYPLPAAEAAAGNQTGVSSQNRQDDSFSVNDSANFMQNVTAGQQSTQQSFDPHVYRELLDNTGFIRDGRRIVMLDASVSHRTITTLSNIFSDNDSDEEAIFSD